MNREHFGILFITMQLTGLELFLFSSSFIGEAEVNYWHYFSIFLFLYHYKVNIHD